MMIKDWPQKLKLAFVPVEENNYRPKFLEGRVLLWCLLALFVLKALTVPFLIYFPKNVFFGDVSKMALIELLNKDRQSQGLAPLQENPELDSAAIMKAQDMLAKDYFAHVSPQGITPWYWFRLADYNYQTAGENLAIGFLDSGEVEQAWLDSPLHRANLLNPNYKDIGIAVISGEFGQSQTTVVVQLFGTLQPVAAQQKAATATAEVATKEAQTTTTAAATEKQTLSAESSPPAQEPIPATGGIQEKIAINIFSFFHADYYKILQVIIYGFLALIILALLINIFVRIDVQHVNLIIKALCFIAVLVLFVLIDKGEIVKLIPHAFNIY
jgi:hypothetical protein